MLHKPSRTISAISLIIHLSCTVIKPLLRRERRRRRRIRLTETLSKLIHVNVNFDSEIRNGSVRPTLKEWWTMQSA